MSNGYVVAASVDVGVARDIGEGFGLEVIDAGAVSDDAALAEALASAANVGLILSGRAAADPRFGALVRALRPKLARAQIITLDDAARTAFAFLPMSWPSMSLADAQNLITRRREAMAPPAQEAAPPTPPPSPPPPPPPEPEPEPEPQPEPVQEPQPAPPAEEPPRIEEPVPTEPDPASEPEPVQASASPQEFISASSDDQSPLLPVVLIAIPDANGRVAQQISAVYQQLARSSAQVSMRVSFIECAGEAPNVVASWLTPGAFRPPQLIARDGAPLGAALELANEEIQTLKESQGHRIGAFRPMLIVVAGAAPTDADWAETAEAVREAAEEGRIDVAAYADVGAAELQACLARNERVGALDGDVTNLFAFLTGGKPPPAPQSREESEKSHLGGVAPEAPGEAPEEAPPLEQEYEQRALDIVAEPAPEVMDQVVGAPAPAPEPEALAPMSEQEQESAADFDFGQPPTAPSTESPAQAAPPLARKMSASRARVASAPADATAFAPKKLRRGTPELVRIVVHQPTQLKEVIKAARRIDPRAAPAPQGMSIGDVAFGAHVGISLEVSGATCDGALQRRAWHGQPIDFAFSAEADGDAKQAVFLVRLFIDDAQIGVLAFTRAISGPANKPAPSSEVRLKRHKRVFISYSSQDREIVSTIATAYASAGVDHFWDRTSLKSGEQWGPRLRREIERADLFHLCWSKAAAKSPWVEKEAEHALAQRQRRKLPEITVQMLDGPPWAPHPPHLNSINFDDFVRAAIVGYARGDGADQDET